MNFRALWRDTEFNVASGPRGSAGPFHYVESAVRAGSAIIESSTGVTAWLEKVLEFGYRIILDFEIIILRIA